MPLSTSLHGKPSTRLRGLAWLALADSAVLQARQNVSDGGGDPVVGWQVAGTVSCRVYPVTIRGRGRVAGGALSEQATHFLVTPLGTVLGLADRAVIANRGTYEVTMALERTEALTTVYEVFEVV
jgi:hypothetical protein